MGGIEFGKCDICGKETELERTYFYYPIHCECCGSKDKDGQKQHFELVHHCKDCPAPMPKEIHPLLRSMNGDLIRANISNILPSDIQGMFIIRDKVINISYLEKFKKLPHLAIDYDAKTLPNLPWGVKVVDDWAYAPNLYHFDTEWHVTWIHCSEGDGTLDFHYNTPEECIDKAYDFCVENKLLMK